jgi:hypothetical protein
LKELEKDYQQILAELEKLKTKKKSKKEAKDPIYQMLDNVFEKHSDFKDSFIYTFIHQQLAGLLAQF